jgi:parallel beta-helix repeat protein
LIMNQNHRSSQQRLSILITLAVFIMATVGSCKPEQSNSATQSPTTAPPPTQTLAPQGKTIIVTNAADIGPGSLRQALEDAQPYDVITFDPAVFPPDSPATIFITSGLPQITQGNLTIDASDAGVILDGNSIPAEADVTGLSIASEWNIVRGLQIINFPGAGIWLNSGSHHNIIGGDQTIGDSPLGRGNLISRNGNIGIGLYEASYNIIKGNYIGTDTSGSQAWGNQYEGIYIEKGSNNEISQNLISDNGASGITLHGSGSHSNVVSENIIGIDVNKTMPIGNHNNGVEIRQGAHDNIVGPDNIIANTNSYSSGIQIYGSDSIENTVHQNSIYDTRWMGVDLWGGGNLELAPPIIIEFNLSTGSIRGVAYPNATVEIFSIDKEDRSVFEGQATADNTGLFVFEKGAPFTGPNLTASATDVSGNTSEFSLTTGGQSGTTILQLNNALPPTRLVAFESNQLEDNHIASFWHSLWGYSPLSELLDETRYLGAKRYRFAINGGEADKVDWSKSEFSIDPEHEEFISNLAANGIQMTYNLSFWDIATWPEGTGAPCPRFKTEEDIQHYLEYVRFIVSHFKDRIQYYEIWNEPDNTTCPQWIEVRDYIELVRRTVPIIRGEYPEAKIQVGGTAGLGYPGPRDYLFNIIDSDIMPLVDVVSWHPFYGDSPEFNSDYYYAYPSIVQQIKDIASSHGFVGEYEADEMNWRPFSEPEIGTNRQACGEIAYTKYWARGIMMNRGMDVTAGNLRIPHQWVTASYMVHNLSTIMAGASSTNLPVEIRGEAENIVSYAFSLPNGDYLITLWTDGVAVDYDAGIPSDLVILDFASWNATGIDVLNGFEQELITEIENGELVIRDLLIRDYPLILRLIP